MRRSAGMAARGRARVPRAGAGLGMMGGPGVGQGPAGRMPTMLRRPEVQQALGLTAEQKKKLEDIAFNSAKAAIQGRSTLQIEHMELTRLMSSANPDRAAIDKKLQDISQAQAALTRSVINGQLDARGVLTKEQQEKMPQVMQKLRAERVQQPGPGQEPGPKSQTEPRPQKSRTIPIPKAPSPPDKQ